MTRNSLNGERVNLPHTGMVGCSNRFRDDMSRYIKGTWRDCQTLGVQDCLVEKSVEYRSKESGRIRRRFGRNVRISQRLKNCRRFINVFECYSFNVILEYSIIDKILPTCIMLLQNMIPNRAIRSISYDNRPFLPCF